MFLSFRGSNIDQKWIRKQHPAGTGLQERLGGLLGSILEAFCCRGLVSGKPIHNCFRDELWLKRAEPRRLVLAKA